MWKVYSQPWSAWPRVFQGRGVIFMPLDVVEVAAVVIVRGKLREMLLFSDDSIASLFVCEVFD